MRLNQWRQKRFAEYLTDVGKRTLKAGIPPDKHLFPDQFHKMVQSEHENSGTNSKLIATPPKPSMTTNHKKPFNWLPKIEQTGDPGGKENGHHKPDQATRVHRDTTNLHPSSLHPNDLEEIRQPPMPADYSIPQLQNINPSVSTPQISKP